MIIWLASYPKSGNTLVRSMLSAYFFSKDGTFNFDIINNIKQFPSLKLFEKFNINPNDNDEIIKNYINIQTIINDNKSIQYLKTHSYLFNFYNKYPFTNLNISLGAIYIVRDPRNVVSSLANFESKTIEETANILTRDFNLGGNLKSNNDIERTTTYVGSWGSHYKSWKSFKTVNKYLLIKYEDLISNKEKNFLKILKFIYQLNGSKFSINENKFKNTIKTTEIEHLQKLEKEQGFIEAKMHKITKEKIPFFNQGRKRDWQKILDKQIKDKIEKAFPNEMKELGYL